jgi:hypothetical protein
MASWEDVAAVCRARPLHRKDLDELGEGAPTGPVLVASEPDLIEAWAGRAPRRLLADHSR